MKDKQKGVIALLVAAALAGSFGVLSHYISFNVPLFYQASVRNIIQLVILTALYLLKDPKKSIARRDIKWFALRSACGFVNSVGLFIAFTKITVGTAYFLSFAASTVFGYMLGSWLFGERMNRKGLAALGLSILGLGLVYSVSFQLSTIWYSAAAVIAGIVAPGWSVFSKQISKTYSNIQMNLVDAVFAVMLTVTCSLVLKEPWAAIAWTPVWIAVFALSLIFLVVGLLVVYGFRRVDAQAGTLILLFEVIVGMVLGYVCLRQTIPLRDAAGGAMILSAIFIRTYSKPKHVHVHMHLRKH